MIRGYASLPFLLGALLALPAHALPQAGPYRVTGSVVNSTTGQPVPHCHLTPTLVRDRAEGSGGAAAGATGVGAGDRTPGAPGMGASGAGASGIRPGGDPRRGRGGSFARNGAAAAETPASFDCDGQGHFSIDLAGPGHWRVMATARGYRSALFDEHEGFSSAVVVSEATRTVDLHFRLDADSSIAGYILDEADEPVRNGMVQILMARPALTAEGTRFVPSYTARTDDRGRYEVTNLAPGNYQIVVQAQPWYTQGAAQAGGRNSNTPASPALDVVYPLTWYPGVTDSASAGVVSLRAGEEREADLRLLPIPSVHLHIPAPPADPSVNNGRPPSRFPQIAQLTPNGGTMFVSPQVRFNQNGDVDVSGLGPGTYQLTLQNAGRQQGPGESSTLHVAPGSAQMLEMSALTAEAMVSIVTEGAENESLNVTLTEVDTGRVISAPNDFRRRQRSGGEEAEEPRPATVQVPAGRYQVTLQGTGDFYLKSISAEGAEVKGRVVTIHEGSPKLTLHMGHGRSSVSGFVNFEGKLDAGAMVLLIPATMGDPGSMTVVRRDQTDTDGGFHLAGVLPGRYILLAIDHGWVVNWNDPMTLNPYLGHGVPLDLSDAGKREQNIEAQAP